ncbi:unnamed protein product [Oncorhynchus mykiss]|uniref:Uncharacterized protein n=1 Tax=Oncorhynchus mykiss TaxID=8022 RepID=A0A060XNG9_ONCMY|nr:unnamed protein product [Oncorhynchus mykiss]
MHSYNPEQIMLSAAVRRSSRDVNIMKEKLIFSVTRQDVTTLLKKLVSGNFHNFQLICAGNIITNVLLFFSSTCTRMSVSWNAESKMHLYVIFSYSNGNLCLVLNCV